MTLRGVLAAASRMPEAILRRASRKRRRIDRHPIRARGPRGRRQLDQDDAGPGWFAYFRWYGPTVRFFDKSWSLPDIERRG